MRAGALTEGKARVRLAAGAGLAAPSLARLAQRDRRDQERDDGVSPPPSGQSVGEESPQQSNRKIGAEHRLTALVGGRGGAERGPASPLRAGQRRHNNE